MSDEETIDGRQALAALREADLVCTAEQVQTALDQMGEAITASLEDADPLVIVVMNGALIPASQLFARMDFPFQISYLHVTRYRGATSGGDLHWVSRPDVDFSHRTVLVIDDIFDEGHTLKAIVDDVAKNGAERVLSAALVNKVHDRKEDLQLDFVGMDVVDRYIFGCGMDYKEYWRNLPAIYALKGH